MSTSKKIITSALPGFMELLPADQILFNKMESAIRQTYENFGFIPLDTPIIERAEVLLAKAGGETEKQIYRFLKGENDLALRFDLTVPLARYVSEHFNELSFPFRRYHIGKVFRGERPQKGRYREFYQCDIDIIGRGKLSLINDAEIPAVIYNVFTKLNLPKFSIRISNRKLITGLLQSLKLDNVAVDVMRIIDKIEKVELAEIKQLLSELGLSDDVITLVLRFVNIKGQTGEIFSALEELNIDNELFQLGLAELKTVIAHVASFGIPADYVGIDLSIARGLDYYTGTVYETVLLDYKGVGSICSGGRYDNLAENYTSQKLPGVGISIGLTRLFSQLQDLGLITAAEASPSRVLVIPFNDQAAATALEVSQKLRGQDIATELYFEEAKFSNKLSYASKLGIEYVVLIGEDEVAGNFLTVKNMKTGQQEKMDITGLLNLVK